MPELLSTPDISFEAQYNRILAAAECKHKLNWQLFWKLDNRQFLTPNAVNPYHLIGA